MDLFEKDMERIIAGKKAELLADLEEAKKRILHELYCVKEGIHTDACGLLADYNRIKAQLAELVTMHDNSLRLAVEKYQKMILEIMGAYENKFEGLDEIIQSIDGKVAEFDALREQLEALIGQLDGYAKEADLNQLQAELTAMIDQLRAELPDAQVQADWNEADETSKAFIKNKPFYKVKDNTVVGTKFHMTQTLASGGVTGVTLSGTHHMERPDIPYKVEIFEAVSSPSGPILGELRYTFTNLHTSVWNNKQLIFGPGYINEEQTLYFQVAYPLSNGEQTGKLQFTYKNTTGVDYYVLASADYTEYFYPESAMYGPNSFPFRQLVTKDGKTAEWEQVCYLRSPNNTVFEVTVSDEGTLTAVPVTN